MDPAEGDEMRQRPISTDEPLLGRALLSRMLVMTPAINPWLLGGLVAGNVLQVAVIYLRPLNHIFHTVPIDLEHALMIGAAGSVVLWAEELRKLIARRASALP